MVTLISRRDLCVGLTTVLGVMQESGENRSREYLDSFKVWRVSIDHADLERYGTADFFFGEAKSGGKFVVGFQHHKRLVLGGVEIVAKCEKLKSDFSVVFDSVGVNGISIRTFVAGTEELEALQMVKVVISLGELRGRRVTWSWNCAESMSFGG
jgi:hypothetical protein